MSAQAAVMNDSLRGPFLRSLLLHTLLLAATAAYVWWKPEIERFGDPNAGGTTVGVQAVKSIPIPTRGDPNPVANDTKSTAPLPPPTKQPPAKAVKPPEDAIPLKSQKQLVAKQPAPEKQKFRSFEELAPNQVTSKSAPALSDPLFALSGSGRVGGMDTTLGTRFGAYAAQIKELVARNWKTGDVPANYKTAPPVTATFDLHRDGTVSNVRIIQKSGIASLDFSVQRAILDAAPFPPIPPGFERNSATVEFIFELKR